MGPHQGPNPIQSQTNNMLLAAIAFQLIFLLASQQTAEAWWLGSDTSSAPVSGRTAVANFDMDGVQGSFKFSQASPSEPTSCKYELHGLKGNNNLYHVHVRPVPAFNANDVRNNATAIAELCSDPTTGGHLNPHHVTVKLPPKSAPSDKYETGDLAGKHGPLQSVGSAGLEDHYLGSFEDDNLPMSGENSIVGRSVVIHKNDGKRWVCASIVATN